MRHEALVQAITTGAADGDDLRNDLLRRKEEAKQDDGQGGLMLRVPEHIGLILDHYKGRGKKGRKQSRSETAIDLIMFAHQELSKPPTDPPEPSQGSSTADGKPPSSPTPVAKSAPAGSTKTSPAK